MRMKRKRGRGRATPSLVAARVGFERPGQGERGSEKVAAQPQAAERTRGDSEPSERRVPPREQRESDSQGWCACA